MYASGYLSVDQSLTLHLSVKTEHCYPGNDRRQTVKMARLRLGHGGLGWDPAKMDYIQDYHVWVYRHNEEP